MSGLTGIARVAAGARHSLAATAAGQWYGWGSNRDGQLGLTGTVGGPVPAALALAGLTDLTGGLDAAPAIGVAQGQRYYGYDAQGGVRYQTDGSGVLTSRYDYDAFGTLLGAAGESPVGSDAYLYRGERYDALTGLYHLRARDYDPALGRFHQIDDFAGFPDNPQSLNRYNYAESNPVGKFDPAGRFAVTSLVTAVYALHLQDQYLGELASAGPQFTFDVDEAMGRLVRLDLLMAQGAPLKLKERELWVRASNGGLLGSWVNESGSSEKTERADAETGYIGGYGFGAGSDVYFLHQSGARFRQGWALKQVEQAWGALQQSRLNLNLGPRFPDDPRSQRIAEGNVRLKGSRWADAIYADALLQATLRSATSVGFRGVRAHFTPTSEGRRYDATGQDITASALRGLNASLGGGPFDWHSPISMGDPDRFYVAAHVGMLESPTSEEIAYAMEAIMDSSLYRLAYGWADIGVSLLPGARSLQYSQTLENAGVDGAWKYLQLGLFNVPGVESLYGAAGYDLSSGGEIGRLGQGLNALAFVGDVATLGGASNVLGVGARAEAAVARAARAGERMLARGAELATQGVAGARRAAAPVGRALIEELAYQSENFAYHYRKKFFGIDPYGRAFAVDPGKPIRHVPSSVSDLAGSASERIPTHLTSHPNAHTIGRHGGAVTDEQLMQRAWTGVAPDGSGGTHVPPMSTAFYSDELMIQADAFVRAGPLQAKIAANPGAVVLTLQPADVGDIGVSLGRGFKRIGSSSNLSANGPLIKVDNIRSVRATFERNANGVWETITMFPESL